MFIMFSKFTLDDSAIAFLNEKFKTDNKYIVAGEKNYFTTKEHFTSDYSFKFLGIENVMGKKSIEVAEIEEANFPSINADVFLSHSSSDLDFVKALSGYLKLVFNLDCFIDSAIWDNVYSLLKKIDSRYSLKKGKDDLYDYNIRNYTTRNVYTILTVALIKMIDNLESMFFIKTPNSINLNNDKTGSSWIYIELIASKLLKQKNLEEYRESIDIRSEKRLLQENYQKMPEFLFPVPLEELINITAKDLRKWEMKYKKQPKSIIEISNSNYISKSLDQLYKIKKIIS